MLLSLNNDLCKSEADGPVEVVPVAVLDADVPACGCAFAGEVFMDEVLGDCLTGD